MERSSSYRRRFGGAWRTKVRESRICVWSSRCLLPADVAAQAVTGTILGTVTDSTGAVMPGATVTLINNGTGLPRAVTTDANGEYTAPSLPTGHVHGDRRAHRLQDRRPCRTSTLGVDQRVRIDLKLEVGAMTRIGDRRRRRRRCCRPPRRSSARRSPTSRSRRCR